MSIPPTSNKNSALIDAMRRMASSFRTLLEIEKLSSVAQIISALATFIISFYTYQLWKTTEQAVQAANNQAAAAKQANDISLRIYQLQSRPRMINSHYDTHITTRRPNKLLLAVSIDVTVKNIGNTPAISMSVYGDQKFVPLINNKAAIPTIYYQGIDRDNSGIKETIFPGREHVVDGNIIDISQQDREDFLSSKKVFALWGVIYYLDDLGNSHWTRYCIYFKDEAFMVPISCHLHNDAD